jgi:hypothetical protein
MPPKKGTSIPNKPQKNTTWTLYEGEEMHRDMFALFSSMCEQKVSAYMPSWALLVMTAAW